MSATNHQAVSVKQEFARKRLRHLVVLVLASAAFVGLALLNGQAAGSPAASGQDYIGIGVGAIVAGGGLFVLRNWRCPACGGYLGRSISPRFCLRCGISLR